MNDDKIVDEKTLEKYYTEIASYMFKIYIYEEWQYLKLNVKINNLKRKEKKRKEK